MYYDAYGRDTSATAPQRPRTRTEYDILNRVTASYDSVGAAPVTIGYDALLPVSVRDQLGHVDSTEYDALGRVSRHFGYASGTTPATIRYDAVGRPSSTTNRRGQVVSVTYDALGRVLTKSGDNTTTDTLTYSANGLIQTAANATDSIRVVSVPSLLVDTVETTMRAPGVAPYTYRVVHHVSALAGGTDSTNITSSGGTGGGSGGGSGGAPAQFVTRQ